MDVVLAVLDVDAVEAYVGRAVALARRVGIAGAIGGGMDTFLSKNKAKSWDAKLARWTKWVAIAFMIITLVLVLIQGK